MTNDIQSRIRLAGWYMDSCNGLDAIVGRYCPELTDMNRRAWKWFDLYRMIESRRLAALGGGVSVD